MTLDKPGFYLDIDEKTYHGDCCPAPSLSSSMAKILFNQSPGHAWWAHPRFNKQKALEVEESTKAQGMGTALHKLILGKGRETKVLDYDNYRTKDAQNARDKAIADGLTPLLEKEMKEAETIAESARRQIARTDLAELIGPDKGEAEVTMVWQEDNGIWCRSRIDWLPHAAKEGGHIIVPDLKTTTTSGNPADWQRQMFDYDYDIQAAFYERGLRKLIPDVRSVDFRFVVIEQKEPYAVSLCSASGETIEHARDTVALAIDSWGALLKRGNALEDWGFYGTETHPIDPPVWRTMAGELLRMRMGQRIADWQKPHNPDMTQPA